MAASKLTQIRFTPSFTNKLVYGFYGVISIIMDIQMLQGIKVRAETTATQG